MCSECSRAWNTWNHQHYRHRMENLVGQFLESFFWLDRGHNVNKVITSPWETATVWCTNAAKRRTSIRSSILLKTNSFRHVLILTTCTSLHDKSKKMQKANIVAQQNCRYLVEHLVFCFSRNLWGVKRLLQSQITFIRKHLQCLLYEEQNSSPHFLCALFVFFMEEIF